MPKTAQKDASVATVKKQGAAMKHIKKYWQWYAMMLIPVVYYLTPISTSANLSQVQSFSSSATS